MQERLSALADRTEALRVENDELMGRVHKNEMQLSRAEDELSQLSSRIWEEYELTYALAEESARRISSWAKAKNGWPPPCAPSSRWVR